MKNFPQVFIYVMQRSVSREIRAATERHWGIPSPPIVENICVCSRRSRRDDDDDDDDDDDEDDNGGEGGRKEGRGGRRQKI